MKIKEWYYSILYKKIIRDCICPACHTKTRFASDGDYNYYYCRNKICGMKFKLKPINYRR